MKYYYIIMDEINEDAIVYAVETDSQNKANFMFIKKFLPLLSDTDPADLDIVMKICSEFSYKLVTLSEEDIKMLE